jgi:hypothetical protein
VEAEAEVIARALSAEDIADLAEFLRKHDYEIGVEQCLAAQDLLLALAAEQVYPSEWPRVAGWLAPVFCRSPRQQAEFHILFESWNQGRKLRPPVESSATSPPVRYGRFSWFRASYVFWVIAGAVVAAAVYMFQSSGPVRSQSVNRGPSVDPYGIWSLSVFALIWLSVSRLWRWLARKVLRRHERPEAKSHSRLEFPVARSRVWKREYLGLLARSLRQLRPVGRVELDVTRTVEASARRAGLFSPVERATSQFPSMSHSSNASVRGISRSHGSAISWIVWLPMVSRSTSTNFRVIPALAGTTGAPLNGLESIRSRLVIPATRFSCSAAAVACSTH